MTEINDWNGAFLPDDDDDGWTCPHCDHVFWVASAWSEDDGATGGMLCPECGEFISNDELGIEEDEPRDFVAEAHHRIAHKNDDELPDHLA